jgi:hypothetical protein
VTDKQAQEVTGHSVTWLRQHECLWCSETALNAVKYGCRSAYGQKCDPIERAKKPVVNHLSVVKVR